MWGRNAVVISEREIHPSVLSMQLFLGFVSFVSRRFTWGPYGVVEPTISRSPLSRFACCLLDFLVCCSGLTRCCCCSFMDFLFRQSSFGWHSLAGFVSTTYSRSIRVPTRWIFLFTLIRVGEASHPGPRSWQIGVCNPAGLNHKSHMFVDDPVDLWLVSETHLSADGHRSFVDGLRLHGAPYRWSVSGFPVKPRSTCSNHGQWSGVLALSSHPTRRLAHSWPQPLHETSRLVLSTTFCSGLWLQGVVAYCPPTGPTHPQAKQSANGLLHAAVHQLAQMDGPRYLAGDFNHDLQDLESLQQLQGLHFIEVQDLQQSLTGVLPKATCKHKTRRDFLYISPELVPLFRGVVIDHDRWIDHATVVATFEGGAEDMVRFPWPLPASIDWPCFRPLDNEPTFDFQPKQDISDVYHKFWHDIEQSAQDVAILQHRPLSKKCFGRAARKQPLKVSGSISPLKCGRHGDLQPEFYGLSFAHKHHFRQLRRLQSYHRLSMVELVTAEHIAHRVSLWRSILNSPGFFPHFAEWWTSMFPACPVCVPSCPPGSEVAGLIFEVFSTHVRQLESQLRKSHRGSRASSSQGALCQLYRAVKRDAPAQVDVLFESKRSAVVALDADDQAVELESEVDWDATQPVWINGIRTLPIVCTPDKLWLESLDSIEPGHEVVQPRRIGKLDQVFLTFVEYWSAMWSAHAEVPLSRWEAIMDFTVSRVGRVDLPPAPMHVDLLRATARSKKSKAATGLDGVSRADVLALTSNQFQHLKHIYEHAHCTGSWPDQMLNGVVKSLAKKVDPSGVTDYRPITVFSFCYRLWSSLQSRYWLSGLEPVLDRFLCGNRNGFQAASLWRRVLESVESAHSSSEPLAGVVLDLTKAYNLLPRLPCLGLALRCGMDHGTICAWAGALSQMVRRFWIQGSVSQGVPSNRGFPEGCGLSCLAMLVLNQAWHLWIQESHRLFQPLSYVDNWEILCSDPRLIGQAFAATLEFTEALDLRLDRSKTSCWAVDANARKQLRAEGFTVVNCCRDLGAQMVFSRQIRNATQKARFESLPDLWSKLKKAKGTYRAKLRIVKTAGWPRALHGIASAFIGRKHFHRLRTGMMQALSLNKPGSNAFLQCCLEDGLDPQCWAIMQSIREWRTLGDRCHQLHMLECLQDLDTHLHDASLTGILQQRLQVLGWTIDVDGFISDRIGRFDLTSCNWAELTYRVGLAWQDVVASQVQHRGDFSHFNSVNVPATRKSLMEFDVYDQGVLHNNLIGATVTNAHACHWSTTGSSECPACGQADSLFHRYWVCAASADLRRHIPWHILQLVPTLPRVLTCHSWTLRSPFVHEWNQYLDTLPQVVPKCPCPADSDWIDLFTDGSCMFPKVSEYRFSAWAVCYAPPPHLEFESTDVKVLSAAPLGGLIQTAFRSELFALMVALTWAVDWCKSVRIWTDCQGVLDKFSLILDGGHRIQNCGSNNDLWEECERLYQELGRGRVQTAKVEAHQTWSSETTEVIRWTWISNACVDAAAKAANNQRTPEEWDLWFRHAQATFSQQQTAEVLRGHQVAVSKRWTAEYGKQSVSLPTAPHAPRVARHFQLRCSGLHIPAVAPPVIVASWGTEFTDLFLQWWGDVLDFQSSPTCWTSFAQLYIDFQIVARHPGLVKCGRGWSNSALLPGSMPERHPFRLRCKWFRLTLQQWLKAIGVDASTAQTRPSSCHLACHIGCIALPAKPARLHNVEQWLRRCISQPICGLGAGLDTLPPGW